MDRFQSETYSCTRRHFRSEEDMIEWEADNQPETVVAAVLSACCGAGTRIEVRGCSTCPATGYRDEGGLVDVCANAPAASSHVSGGTVAQRKPLVSCAETMRETQDV